MIQRRGFLAAALATGVAPAILRSGVIMPIRPSVWSVGTSGSLTVYDVYGNVIFASGPRVIDRWTDEQIARWTSEGQRVLLVFNRIRT